MRTRIAWTVCVGLLACVGDSVVPNDGGVDSSPDVATGQDATTKDVSTTDAPVEAGDAGVDVTVVCSDPLVGGTLQLPTNTFNAFTVTQSGPLVTGDYDLTGVNVYSPCNFNCPSIHKGTIFGGFHFTSLGSGNYDVTRHVEMQQTAKSVRIDHFTGVYDQLNKTLTLTETCSSDGGISGDGGAVWSTTVSVITDGGITLSQPDLPVELSTADGGFGGTGTPYLFVQRQ